MNHSNDTSESWDLEIKPKASFFHLNLKDVWQYRYLLWLFVKRDFTASYKQTILGPTWHFIQPLFTTITYFVIFNKIAGLSTDGAPPVLFYMSGITIWNYFASCLNSTSNTFVANAGIYGKVYFPRLIVPLSSVASNIVRFGIQFLLLAFIILWFKVSGIFFNVSFYVLLIPVLLFIMAGIGLGLGIIISSLTTKYKDLTVLIGFAVQLLMYVTPVIYPLSAIQSKYLYLIQLNPITPLVEAFRFSLLGSGSFTLGSLLYSFGFMCVVLFAGLLIFSKVERSFMDTV